jgi:hypothetical protein
MWDARVVARQDKANDLMGKAASKMTAVAGQAVAAAARRQRIEAERRVLADLRAQALQFRAQIGEEMFKLWQTRTLPPSSLDHLFEAIERTMVEISAQNERLERMSAPQIDDSSDRNAASDDEDDDVVEMVLPPPPLPAPQSRIITGEEQSCAGCGAKNPPNRRFCGDCGSPLT